MPESVAIIKLRGFLEDLGGKVIESQPGLVRVLLGEAPIVRPPRGILGWFRKAEPICDPNALQPVAIDLHLSRRPGSANQLDIKTVFRAVDGPLPVDARWLDRTEKLILELKSYLIAQR